MALSFAVNWDYRCPFGRIVNDHVTTGIEAGADWDVTFRAFSLDQSHVEEGDTPVWDAPDRFPGLLANEVGIVVRDRDPDHFLAVHRALFEARHAEARDTRKREVLTEVLTEAGADAAAVLAEVDDGWPLETFRKEHSDQVERLQVFGVPSFISGDGQRAAFVRLLDRPEDAQTAIATIERVVDMLDGWPTLNEFKHTQIGR